MNVFVDTAAWVAIADSNDQYASEAARQYRDLILKGVKLATSDFVLVETYNLLSRTIGSKPTITFGNKLKANRYLEILSVTSFDWERAWKILEKYEDKDFSFTDCTSFALMERNKIKQAFTFDSHFRQFGFGLIP
ncbi:MAG: PIN domain-containing protein [Nitrospirae bacterium]|nr:PIN domain-containing protein [Nitrospirota bacterium]